MGMEGAMTPPRADKRFRCRICGVTLPAWLPVAKQPDGAMLLYHLSQQHPAEVKPYLERMRTEDIRTVTMEVYERVEDQ
jgi:hypothetical protein